MMKTVKKLYRFIFYSVFCALTALSPATAWSQEKPGRLTLLADTNKILIGSQFRLTVTLEMPENFTGSMPQLPDTFSKLEVLVREPVDTLIAETGGLVRLRQQYILTSFDSGYHVIPPVSSSLRSSRDTTLLLLESKPLLITVKSVDVDTSRAIRDIKPKVEMPFTWQDALPWVAGLALIAAIIYLLSRWLKNRKKGTSEPVQVIPSKPAHELALEQLQELQMKKLWQQGNFKAYHSELSDIVRTFIDNRWNTTAMEMTTDEILHLTVIRQQDSINFQSLKAMLELADLVKFAKLVPIAADNEKSMESALQFVKANIPSEVEKEAVS